MSNLLFLVRHINRVKSRLIEDNYKNRRMAYFADEKDIKTKKAALEKALKDLIKLQNTEED